MSQAERTDRPGRRKRAASPYRRRHLGAVQERHDRSPGRGEAGRPERRQEPPAGDARGDRRRRADPGVDHRPVRARASQPGSHPGRAGRARHHGTRPVAPQRAGALPGPGVRHPLGRAVPSDPVRLPRRRRRDPAHPGLPRAQPPDRGARGRRPQPGLPHHRPEHVPGLPQPGPSQRQVLPPRGDRRGQRGGGGHRGADRHPSRGWLPGGRCGGRARCRAVQRHGGAVARVRWRTCSRCSARTTPAA